MGLAGEDDRTVVTLEDDGLVPVDVSGGRDDVNAGSELGLAVQQLIACTDEVDQGCGRVLGRLGGAELLALAEDRLPGEGGVATDVVEVEMTVDDQVDVVGGEAQRAEGVLDRDPPWPVPGVGLGAGLAKTGVEEEQSCRCSREVTQDRIYAWGSGPCLFRGANEGPEFELGHIIEAHGSRLDSRECTRALASEGS